MGAPTSSITYEILLQYLKHTYTVNKLIRYGIRGYFRYTDDILIVYNLLQMLKKKKKLDEFNSISPYLEFTLEQVQNNTLNFLDITIKRCNAESEWQFILPMYRKTTTTDCIIPNDSCHPIDHRLACFRFLSNQLYTYSLLCIFYSYFYVHILPIDTLRHFNTSMFLVKI
jgi:hypothetical protein